MISSLKVDRESKIWCVMPNCLQIPAASIRPSLQHEPFPLINQRVSPSTCHPASTKIAAAKELSTPPESPTTASCLPESFCKDMSAFIPEVVSG